jgi:hypothetical protein
MPQMQVPFDFAQGRLSTPLKYAPLRMTGLFFDMNYGLGPPGHIRIRFRQRCHRDAQRGVESGKELEGRGDRANLNPPPSQRIPKATLPENGKAHPPICALRELSG